MIADAFQKVGARTLIATSSDLQQRHSPRAAALLDAPMLTDVLAIEEKDGAISYRRPISAGSMLATVQLQGDKRVLTDSRRRFCSAAQTMRHLLRWRI